jgi:upstream activation factor subunit UAF30
MPRSKPATPAAAAATTPIPVAAKKTKAEPKSAPKAAAAPAEAPAAPAPPVEAPQDTGLTDTFSDFATKLQQMSQAFTSLKADFRAMEKECTRKLKQAQKDSARRKRKTGSRQPSGFVKPTLISNELASFLKRPQGSEMARTEVTREINAYIRSNNLQDKQNGRKINPDGALSKLLKLKKTDELTYFNLQRYMSPHFAKAQQAAVAK